MFSCTIQMIAHSSLLHSSETVCMPDSESDDRNSQDYACDKNANSNRGRSVHFDANLGAVSM
jgi:hypothetical protein